MTTPSPADLLRSAAAAARAVLLTGPTDPDGDSIGACLALARGLAHLGTAHVDVAGDPTFRYDWLPGADRMVRDDRIDGPYDLVVVLDGDSHRLEPPIERAFRAAGTRAIVDHHASTGPDGYEIALIEPSAASTCELVHHLIEAWGVPLDRDLAELLYTGLIFDTGGFRHSNTSPATHRLAARLLETGIDHSTIAVRVLSERRPAGLRLLGHVVEHARLLAQGAVALGSVTDATARSIGADRADLEGIVDALVFTRGVEVACLCVERGPRKTKLSLRSRKRREGGEVDVALLAARLGPGGGGHPRAAGVVLDEPLDAVLARVPAALESAVGHQPLATGSVGG